MSLAILTLLYLITRLINLTIIPIFTDEAMYLRWSQIGIFEPQKYLFISLIDGKQPLFVWLTYPFVRFIADPLVAGRLVSVIAGLATMIFLYLLTRLLFENQKVAVLTALLYILFPFAVIYDRLAVMDSVLSALFVASLYSQIKLAQHLNLKNALWAALVMGLGFLTKSSAIFFILLMPFATIFMKDRAKKNILRFGRLAILAAILALSFNLILYISPLHGMIKMKNEVFVYTLPEMLRNPFNPIQTNLPQLLSYFSPYFGTAWLTLIVLGVLIGILRRKIRILYLFSCFLFPFLSLAVFGRLVYPRFILFMVMPFLPIIAFTAITLGLSVKNVPARIIFFLITFVYVAFNSFSIIYQPTMANLPSIEAEQLLNSWPAGYGVKEVVAYIQNESKNQKIFLATEGTQGLFPYALELYFIGNNNVTIKGYWPAKDIPPEVREKAQTEKTYFIFKDTLHPAPQVNTREVLKVRRGVGNNYLKLLEVLPSS